MQEMSSLRSSSVCLRTRAGLPRPHLGALKLQGEKRSGQKRPVPTAPPAGAAVPHKPADEGPWAQSGLPSARHHVSEGKTLGAKCKPTTHSKAVIRFHVVVSHFQLNSTKPINMGHGKYPKVRVHPGPGRPKASRGMGGHPPGVTERAADGADTGLGDTATPGGGLPAWGAVQLLLAAYTPKAIGETCNRHTGS